MIIHLCILQYLGKAYQKKSALENVKEYRCFKNFSDTNFINDLKMIQWDTVEEFDDCDLAWKWFNKEFSKVCDKHCPLKRKKKSELIFALG